MQVVAPLATLLWLGFLPLDWIMATWIEPGPFGGYLALRLLILPVGIYASIRARAKPEPSRWVFRATQIGLFVPAAWAISGMCLLGNGPRALYFGGIAAVIAARAATVAEPWKSGLGANAAIIGGHLVVVGVGWRLLGHPPDDLALGAQVILLTSAAVIAAMGVHAHWAIRREVLSRHAVGRYTLVSIIGSGGMGEVWRARTAQLRRDVAIKVLRHGRDTAESLMRFEREAAALSQLGHPHTVRIFDYGVSVDGTPFYAMEMLEGEDLEHRLQRGRLSPLHLLAMGRQVAGALAEAHSLGIVHRDVKPANVFLVSGVGMGIHVKLLDFGIASLGDEAGEELMGTPGFTAPELLVGQPATPSSDVYAVGALLYWAWRGVPIFARPDGEQRATGHAIQPGPPPLDESASVAELALQDLVMRCLARSPEKRPRDGAALLDALDVLVPWRADASALPGTPGLRATETMALD